MIMNFYQRLIIIELINEYIYIYIYISIIYKVVVDGYNVACAQITLSPFVYIQ